MADARGRRTFIDFKFDPLPSGFFCALSEPFTGRIVWQGLPIATEKPGALGKTDTIIERLDDAVFDKRGRATTRIQVRALSFVSTAPIKTSCGLFQVKAVLDGMQPITRMRLVRNNEKGGFYDFAVVFPWSPNSKRRGVCTDRSPREAANPVTPAGVRRHFRYNGLRARAASRSFGSLQRPAELQSVTAAGI